MPRRLLHDWAAPRRRRLAMGATLLVALATGLQPNPSTSQERIGETIPVQITEWADGDSGRLQRLDTGQELEFRLWGVDTPELRSDHGKRAKAAVERLDANQRWQFTIRQTTRSYGRVVGELRNATGWNLNRALVRDGLAIDCRRYSHGDFAAEEEQSRSNQRGLWNPQDPPNWGYAFNLKACER